MLNLKEEQISDMKDDLILIDLCTLLKNGTMDDMFNKGEVQNLIDDIRASIQMPDEDGQNNKVQKKPTSGNTAIIYMQEMVSRSRKHFKVILNLTPNGKILNH